jgi:hypothetical protein
MSRFDEQSILIRKLPFNAKIKDLRPMRTRRLVYFHILLSTTYAIDCFISKAILPAH